MWQCSRKRDYAPENVSWWSRKCSNRLENVEIAWKPWLEGVHNNVSRNNGKKCTGTALKLLGNGRICSNCGAEWGVAAIDAQQL